MQNLDIIINLFYDIHKDNFKIKTNLNEDKINDVLFDCYRATLNLSPDYNEPKERDIYNIQISLDLSQDKFCICSNTGNKVLTYELIRGAINRWEIIKEEISINKDDLEEIILKNIN